MLSILTDCTDYSGKQMGSMEIPCSIFDSYLNKFSWFDRNDHYIGVFHFLQ